MGISPYMDMDILLYEHVPEPLYSHVFVLMTVLKMEMFNNLKAEPRVFLDRTRLELGSQCNCLSLHMYVTGFQFYSLVRQTAGHK